MVTRVTWEQLNKAGNNLLSPSSVSNGRVFTSGCLGTDAEGKMPESVAEQTKNAIESLGEVLKASGSSFDDVVKVLLFVGDASYVSEVNQIYSKYFTLRPARSCVVVGFPNPHVKVEIECVAEVSSLAAKL
ncbi:hypothetical protein PICMEDRAFT_13736 [Pichia membranifaciens NRRL Y-2026]|uniref:Uncharacterized protein n=1 Tax=Pichia membranifaciens NRRL Y-2026 TaxID=763406 RepID=A0A1E3NFR1_9ASCO|nr:hypothetical protein PICMEDRAFT_13736 [Pichia membranifaciens NRRL Y-2026]ODQ44183.1 hypothetical protein PICMEDRAFT_13736 [Pichia membranifaciens NRRL Y-2026]